jgi:iron(II)-dependent oxidoreductase
MFEPQNNIFKFIKNKYKKNKKVFVFNNAVSNKNATSSININYHDLTSSLCTTDEKNKYLKIKAKLFSTTSKGMIIKKWKSSMAQVPSGEFIMGSNERWDDEAPEHISTTDAFYIDLNEVTNADYKIFVKATKRTHPFHWPEGHLPKSKENHPVIYVSWFDASDYCSWAGKRLPTEQEWEKAARGEEGLIYPWGNEWSLDKSNNPYKNSTGTEPVGSYPKGRSPYGLNDISGNVWEWVDSYYLPHPENPVTRAEYGEDKRVLKGGSWFDCLSYGCGLSAPTFNRSFFTPEVKNNSFGFRCAKTKIP